MKSQERKSKHWWQRIFRHGFWTHTFGLVVMGFGGIIAMQIRPNLSSLGVFILFLFVSFTITMYAFNLYYYEND